MGLSQIAAHICNFSVPAVHMALYPFNNYLFVNFELFDVLSGAIVIIEAHP